MVADGTRRATIDAAVALEERARREIGPVPFVLVVNKCDLIEDWEFDPELEARFAERRWTILRSSAKTGEGVEEAFSGLARKIAG